MEYPYPHSIESAVINVRVHDVQGPDGTGQLTPGQIDQALANLSNFYDGYGITFKLLSTDVFVVGNYHSYLAVYGNCRVNSQPDAIDIYLTDPAWPADVGTAFGIPETGFVLFGETVTNTVVAHEMGHCLGLYHTHETAFCAEESDQSNCAECGDLVCDTAACPTGLTPYVDPADCTLLPAFYDMFPGFDPDPTNIMAYTDPSCLEHASSGQRDRMLAAIEHLPILQAVVDHANVVYDNKSSNTGLAYSDQPYSAVGIDYHNDGGQLRAYEDLFVSMYSSYSRLYECGEIGPYEVPQFNETTGSAFGSLPPINLAGTSQADYDNDGDLDLLVAGGIANTALLYRNEGDGTFSDQSGLLGTTTMRSHVFAGAWADYDGDGWVDLYLCRGNGPGGAPEPDILLRNRIGYNGLFSDATTSEGLDRANANLTNAFGAVWADVTGDGYADLFVVENFPLSSPPDPSIHGKLFVHGSTPLSGFQEEAASRFADLVDVMQQMTAVDAADVDLDGDIDLVAGFEGINQGAIVYVNDGSGYFQIQDAIMLSDQNGTSGVRFVDQDLDGRPDLLVTSYAQDTAPRYYRNTTNDDHAVLFFDDTPFVFAGDAGTRAEGLVSLDWNRDGDQDLFLGRPTIAGQHFYRATAPDGTDHPDQNTIALRLASPDGVNNSAGIGAAITVGFNGQTLLRRVDGGSGRGGQADLVLTFPSDQASGTVPVTVTWPNGWQQNAQVPVQVPGSAPYLLVDDTNPTVVDATVFASSEYDPVSGEMTFVFTWQTEYGFDPSLDKVTLDLSQVPTRCRPSVSEITPATPGTEHVYLRLNTGRYRHTLRWTGWDCEPNCTLPYTATSAHRVGLASTSATRQLKFRFCPTSL